MNELQAALWPTLLTMIYKYYWQVEFKLALWPISLDTILAYIDISRGQVGSMANITRYDTI